MTSSALLVVDAQRNMLQPPHPVPSNGEPAEQVSRRIETELAAAGVSVVDAAGVAFD